MELLPYKNIESKDQWLEFGNHSHGRLMTVKLLLDSIIVTTRYMYPPIGLIDALKDLKIGDENGAINKKSQKLKTSQV